MLKRLGKLARGFLMKNAQRSGIALAILIGVLLVANLTTALAQEADSSAGKTIFILDGSGSMWGRVNKKSKIIIAKESMIEQIKKLDLRDSAQIGLQVYGHRREEDCNDIEIVAPMGSDQETIIESIRSIVPKGKTPITQSLLMAGEALRSADGRTSVVLISDGNETCDADPCAVVKDLRNQDIQVTFHVIGFDVKEEEREQLACIAEAGGGKYFSAMNIEEMEVALEQVIQEVAIPLLPDSSQSEPAQPAIVQQPPPQPPQPSDVPRSFVLIAKNAADGQFLTGDLQWIIVNARTDEMQILDHQSDRASVELIAGDYELFLASDEMSISGEAQLTVNDVTANEITVDFRDVGNKPFIKVPNVVAAGSVFRFTWNGPNVQKDRLFVAQSSMADNRYYDSKGKYYPVESGLPGNLVAPSRPGSYEVRYYSYNNADVLVRTPLKVSESTVEIDAPRTVLAGSMLRFTWQGPNLDGDMLFISKPDEPENRYMISNAHRHLTRDGRQAELPVPTDSGTYEIRYFSWPNGQALAKRALIVQ